MADAADQAARLEEILVRNRGELEAGLPEELLLEVAEIEEQNQFDDNRSKAQKAIRDAVESAGKALRMGEVSGK